LADLEKKKKDMMEFMTPTQQAEYMKTNREAILGDVSDEDVKSEIAQDFMKLRSANPNLNIDQLVQKLKDIKEQKETVKRLDEEANTLMDEMKKHMEDYTDDKKQEMIDAATEKGWNWMKENGGDNLKYGLSNLESMKAKYDKASEAYKKLDDQITKIKAVYDEIKSIYTKVDSFNKLVAEGKIDKGQAKVLKGGVLLGKGLEYATGYVPVFGSTASTVTKETFGVVIKVATQRAERSNSLQKCFDDPEHCDPNGISGY
jgi:exonuclease VII large subunit